MLKKKRIQYWKSQKKKKPVSSPHPYSPPYPAPVLQGQQLAKARRNFFCKGPYSKYFGLVGPTVSTVTTQLLHHVKEAATDDT